MLLLLVHRTLPKGAWWWKSAVLGFLNMGAFFALVYLAAQLLPTSVASVIMALAPLAMMAVAWPALAERPRVLPAIGACLGVAGVRAMVLTGSETLDVRGVLASLAAMTILTPARVGLIGLLNPITGVLLGTFAAGMP